MLALQPAQAGLSGAIGSASIGQHDTAPRVRLPTAFRRTPAPKPKAARVLVTVTDAFVALVEMGDPV
ncbi:MAG: hypothetical protein ABWX87_04700, partial [Pseudoxanthomonas sp.]